MTPTGPTDRDLPRTAADMERFLGNLEFTGEPAELPEPLTGEPKVVRSLRLDADIEVRARAIAKERGVPMTTLMREWILDGVRASEGEPAGDALAELGRILVAANRTYEVVRHRTEAA